MFIPLHDSVVNKGRKESPINHRMLAQGKYKDVINDYTELGRKAYKKDKCILDNPFATNAAGLEKHRWWMIGFLRAEKREMLRKFKPYTKGQLNEYKKEIYRDSNNRRKSVLRGIRQASPRAGKPRGYRFKSGGELQ